MSAPGPAPVPMAVRVHGRAWGPDPVVVVEVANPTGVACYFFGPDAADRLAAELADAIPKARAAAAVCAARTVLRPPRPR